MRKCKENINISSADIQLRKNQIGIVISREPDTPLISELRRQIEELREIGLSFDNIDKKIADALAEMDVVTKAYLAEVISQIETGEEMKAELKEWADARFMRKMFLSQEAYEALENKEENVLYCII